jgi:hypothetical protein
MFRFFDRLKLTPSERRLVVGIVAVAFVVVNYWVVWPRFGDFRTVSEDLASMEEKRRLFQREIDRRPTYEVLLRKLQAEGSVLPAGEERIQFRSDMERLAREIGLQVPRWGEVLPERGGQSTNAFFEAIGLTLQSVGGTERQFVDFLHRVGASNSTIRVRELTLNLATSTPGRRGTNLLGTIAGGERAAGGPAGDERRRRRTRRSWPEAGPMPRRRAHQQHPRVRADGHTHQRTPNRREPVLTSSPCITGRNAEHPTPNAERLRWPTSALGVRRWAFVVRSAASPSFASRD